MTKGTNEKVVSWIEAAASVVGKALEYGLPLAAAVVVVGIAVKTGIFDDMMRALTEPTSQSRSSGANDGGGDSARANLQRAITEARRAHTPGG